jgi:hypothetical protein
MTSKTTVLIVAVGLVVLAGLIVSGAVMLIALGENVPDPLWTLAGTTIGALASLLVSTRSTVSDTEIDPTAMPVIARSAPK